MLPYIWEVIKNILALMILFILFEKAHTGFESAALAGLVIIYIQSTTAAATHAQATYHLARDMQKGFSLLKPQDEQALDLEEIKLADEKFTTLMKKFYINAFFSTLFFLLALVNLLG